MKGRVFVDTNILVYAHDIDAGSKRALAAGRLEALWDSRRGALSVQVLQEFYVNVTRKIRTPLGRKAAREVVEAYGTWHVEALAAPDVSHACLIEERSKISFWDALIVVAAKKSGAERLLSEDMNAGQSIEGVTIENPFRALTPPVR